MKHAKLFPRGSKKKGEGDGAFIFNTKETVAKRTRDTDKFIKDSKKKRFKTKEVDGLLQQSEFVIGKTTKDEDEVSDGEHATNKLPMFSPAKGSLLMMAVSRVHKDQFVVCNFTRNKKGYMSAIEGHIIGKKTGQFVYGTIVGTRRKEQGAKFVKLSKSLQITDNLNIFNMFLTADKLVKGMQLQGSVESKEGKGYVINLHTKDESKAFLNFKDYKGPELHEEDIVEIILKGAMSKSQKIIKCIHPSAIENIEDWAIDTAAEIYYECVKPGFLVQARIESIVENGLNVSFGKGINGVIFIDHLKQDLSKYKKKKKILARVISVEFEKKIISLSELDHIVHQTPVTPNSKQGDVITNVKVVKKVYGKSYLVEGDSTTTGQKVQCFLHQNHIAAAVNLKEGNKRAQKDILKLHEKGELEVGEQLQCNVRIKEFNHFDNMPIASSLQGINEGVVLSWDTIKGGITVEGTIREIVEDNYLVVDINEHIFGRVHKMHLADAPIKRINKKFKNSIGKKMTFKTWKAIGDKEILELTMKESIVKEKVFVPKDIDDPRIKNGVKLSGVLVAQTDLGYIIEYYNDLRGFLPFESLEKHNEKFAFQKGALVTAYLIVKTKKGLSLTISEEESVNFKTNPSGKKTGMRMPKVVNFEQGSKLKGIVCKFDKTCSFPLTVKLSDRQLGSVAFTDLGLKEGFDENELERIYEIGTVLDVYVKVAKDGGEGKVECSLVEPGQESRVGDMIEGQKVLCRYVKFKTGFGATVQVSTKKYAFIDVCELTDEIEHFNKTLFFARVIDTKQTKVQLSARESIVDDEKYKILKEGTSMEYKQAFGELQKKGDLRNLIFKYHNWRELLTENLLVRGYVTSVNQHGVFIKLARNLSVRASNREISDNPSVTPESFLTKNTIVLGRILNFYKDKINLSLRESIVTYGIDEVSLDSIEPGVKAKLLVLSIANKLAFSQIIGSRYKCKVKLAKEDPSVKVGQKIIARVKSVSKETPPKIMMHEVEECHEELNEEFQELNKLMDHIKQVQAKDYEEKDEESDGEDEVKIEKDEVEQNIEDLKELLEVGEEAEGDDDLQISKFFKNYLLDFGVEDSDEDMPEGDYGEGDMEIENEGEAEPEGEMEVDEAEGEEEKKETKGKQPKGKSINTHIQDEINIMLKERGLEQEEHDENYYEQALLSTPNNSFVWIHYMSHVLAKKGYKEAKNICERAVKTIDMTNLKEKLNLWIAYMNFESKFGKEKEFQSIVKRALKINDQKEIYLAVIEIYLKRKNYKIIEGIYLILSKKYNFNLDIWKKYIEYLFLAHNIKSDSSHSDHILLQDVDLTPLEKVLSKAVQILDRKQQIELIRKFASEEYKYGNTEKGRTMYESIIHSYPKRTDIIATFLDLEIKFTKNKLSIRKIFDKLLARENVKLKQIKFLFKRYLEFEVEHGSEKDVEKVKAKAAEFAEKMGKGDEEAEGEQSEEEQSENEGDKEAEGEQAEAEGDEESEESDE